MAALPENDRLAGPYIAEAGQTDFAADFPLIKGQGLCARIERAGAVIRLTGAQLDAIDPGESGFTCRLSRPAMEGDRVWIFSLLPTARDRTHAPNGAVRTQTLEGDAEELQAQHQEVRRDIGRAVLAPMGERDLELPIASRRSLRYLAFDAAGAPVASPGPTPGDTPMTDAGRQLVADADFDAMLSRLGGDRAESVAITTLDRMLAAPAYSLARSERGRVDALRGVPDLAMARAGSVDISPYVQSVFDEFGPVEVWLDSGTFRWGQTVTLPEGGYLKAEGGKALIRPLAALGACTDPTGGFAIRIARSYCGVRGLRWDGAQAGQAGAVVIDCGQITGVPGSGIVHDVVAS
ncbi:hypothetical protein, partial [Brevundimonas naejangsanensis]|uniref:hypothetical protein n=1 Tax=Brevundimonas naejangsanensis TaxID=588932 RepID=UPI0026F050F6